MYLFHLRADVIDISPACILSLHPRPHVQDVTSVRKQESLDVLSLSKVRSKIPELRMLRMETGH